MPLPFILWGAGALITAAITGTIVYAFYKIYVQKLTIKKLEEEIAKVKAKENLGDIINKKIETKDYETLRVKIDDGEKGVELEIQADEIDRAVLKQCY